MQKIAFTLNQKVIGTDQSLEYLLCGKNQAGYQYWLIIPDNPTILYVRAQTDLQ